MRTATLATEDDDLNNDATSLQDLEQRSGQSKSQKAKFHSPLIVIDLGWEKKDFGVTTDHCFFFCIN